MFAKTKASKIYKAGKMSTLGDYDNYISMDFSRDYWADDAVDFATELAERFTQLDWINLKIIWRDKPLIWQERCLHSISLLANENASKVLEDMLTSPLTSIAYLAVEGLQAINTWVPKTPHLSVLNKLSKKASVTDLANIEDLLSRNA